jgi:hypothetical protein
MSDFNTQIRSAWLKGSNNFQSPGSKVALHQISLSGLTNAIDTLEGYKHSFSIGHAISSF